ncbi:hypothetical protein BJ878DRAFT_416822 [Calycina marina]|uniref:Uncharacterized protein n=1 Tax=Calycina marina TaxID=1763456 RepID=A0A9P8CGR1_9HELO|nr:hypothetical protein BJ878DRAFT_416822 [Calycina marina]
MARSESESSLSGSAFELIDTDGESRYEHDDAGSSVPSLLDLPDDVTSLAEDTDHSGDESEREEDAPINLPAVEQAVNNAFDTPTIGRSSALLLDIIDNPLTQAIEFEEPFPSLNAETIFAKHTVTDFDEEEISSTTKKLFLSSPPKRMAVTIRQTMTKQGLSTREPLRILYVGSHSAKEDIIRKIASSVTASVNRSKKGQNHRSVSSQLYNVVPVSAFGSERTPEIELMHSSVYQIKVEDCLMAKALRFEDVPEKPDVIKLDLEDHVSYHSVPEGDEFIVEPAWDLPHVAVTYCSDTDDLVARRTLSLATKFMGRHGVPCIAISHQQLFHRGVAMSIDQHGVHMCLESRDTRGRGSIIHRRLPVDLASFLNIDARQMNRNLAYLTGLHDTLDTLALVTMKKIDNGASQLGDLEKSSWGASDSIRSLRKRNVLDGRVLIPALFGLLIFSVLVGVRSGISSYRISSTSAISVNSKVISTVPMSTGSSAIAPPVASITSTATSVMVNTSTKTITVTRSQATGANSLAIVPSMELGKLFQSSAKQTANKSSLCSAEILGPREILIRIPSATMLSWLNKEAISVNVTRGNASVDTERAYSTDDGVVLLLAHNQVYGILNISVITTRKPRINETFQIDFGDDILRTMAAKYSVLFGNAADISAEKYGQTVKFVGSLVNRTLSVSKTAFGDLDETKNLALQQAFAATACTTDAAKSIAQELSYRGASILEAASDHINQTTAKLSASWAEQGEPNTKLWKARVAARLLQYRLQGRSADYKLYNERARAHSITTARAKNTGKSDGCVGCSRKERRHAEKEAKREAGRISRAGRVGA